MLVRGIIAGLLLVGSCGGGAPPAATPAGNAPAPAATGGGGGAPSAPERTLVSQIGDEPTVDCQDRSDQPPDWREPPAPDRGFVMVDAIAFRSGCLSASLLDEAIAEREPDLVRCFETQKIADARVVVRTTWEPGPRLKALDLRPAPGAALPSGAAPLGSCLKSTLAGIQDLGPEPALPAVVDVLLRRGFPDEVETVGID